MRFSEMLSIQSEFQTSELARLFPGGIRDDMLAGIHHSLCSHMIEESQELMDCMPWHFHRRADKRRPAQRYALVEEAVDAFKWLLNVLHLHKVDAGEFEQVFREKTAVVEDRIRTWKFLDSDPGPCLILDLDGVLFDRDSRLIRFAEENLYGVDEHTVTSVVDLRKMLGLHRYEILKEDFYRRGEFSRCNINDRVNSLLTGNLEIPVVILTSRDDRKFPELHWQTMQALKAWGVPYSALLFSQDKAKALLGWCDHDSIAIDDDSDHVVAMNLVCQAWCEGMDTSHLAVARALQMLYRTREIREKYAKEQSSSEVVEPLREPEGRGSPDEVRPTGLVHGREGAAGADPGVPA